ncbi:MAG TPA: hypothetical protein VHE53_00030 [Patescibacteria group bacterium]|nr:hypothetical protein [Patescibacteria group bacterium]
MDFIKKNKMIIGLIVVVLLVGGAALFLTKNKGTSTINSGNQSDVSDVKTMKPEDIGLKLSVKSDGKAVDLSADKLDGVKSIEYEVSYDATVTDEGETANVPRGVVASPIDVNGQSSISKEILLGTCSANVCKYDKVTSDIKFVIRVDFTNGKVGSIETTIPYSPAQ